MQTQCFIIYPYIKVIGNGYDKHFITFTFHNLS